MTTFWQTHDIPTWWCGGGGGTRSSCGRLLRIETQQSFDEAEAPAVLSHGEGGGEAEEGQEERKTHRDVSWWGLWWLLYSYSYHWTFDNPLNSSNQFLCCWFDRKCQHFTAIWHISYMQYLYTFKLHKIKEIYKYLPIYCVMKLMVRFYSLRTFVLLSLLVRSEYSHHKISLVLLGGVTCITLYFSNEGKYLIQN